MIKHARLKLFKTSKGLEVEKVYKESALNWKKASPVKRYTQTSLQNNGAYKNKSSL